MGKMADALPTAEIALRNLLADVSVPVLVRIQSLYCVAGTAYVCVCVRGAPACVCAGVARRRRAQASRAGVARRRRAGVAPVSCWRRVERISCLLQKPEKGCGGAIPCPVQVRYSCTVV